MRLSRIFLAIFRVIWVLESFLGMVTKPIFSHEILGYTAPETILGLKPSSSAALLISSSLGAGIASFFGTLRPSDRVLVESK